jgi:hypothetical protein
MTRSVAVARHLHRKHTAPCQLSHEMRQQSPVIVEPMHCRVGEQQVGWYRRPPLRDVGVLEADFRNFLACPGEHFRRRIDADDDGTGPAVCQQAGDVARSAAKIVDGARTIEWNLCQQVERRAQAMISEFQVSAGSQVGISSFRFHRKSLRASACRVVWNRKPSRKGDPKIASAVPPVPSG